VSDANPEENFNNFSPLWLTNTECLSSCYTFVEFEITTVTSNSANCISSMAVYMAVQQDYAGTSYNLPAGENQQK